MLEAKGQGHRRKCPPKQKKDLQNFFQSIEKFFSGNLQKNGIQKKFLCNLHLRKAKKVFANFPRVFWRYPTKFQRFKK